MSSAGPFSGPKGEGTGGPVPAGNFQGKIPGKKAEKFAKKGRKYLTIRRRYDDVKKRK